MPLLSIYKKDVAAYFNSLTGYLAIGLFLLATGLLLWVFPDTSIPEYGYATLEGFFQLSPYLFLFLVPAVTMRSIAGERAEGTLDLLLSRPIRLWHLLLGKYFAGLTILALALLPTLIYVVAIYRLALPIGNVDTGAIIGSYLGLFLLGAAFVTVGLFTSALHPNSIVAFLLTAALCFLLFYAFDALSNSPLFDAYSYFISALGMRSHYEAVSRGVLDTRDLVYFVSLSLLFLWCTHALLGRHRYDARQRWTLGASVLAGVIAVNAVAAFGFGRIDFTAEKRYTLSPLAKETVRALDQDIRVTLLLDGDLPGGFVRLRRAAIDLLNDLKAYSNGRFTFRIIDPMEGDAAQQQENTETLAALGVTPTNLNVRTANGFMQRLIFPAALVSGSEDDIPVNLLQNRAGARPEEVLNNSIQNLEYAFVTAIRKAVSGTRPLIGITEGHGEPGQLQLHDAVQSLMSGFQVGFVNLDSIPLDGLRQLAALIVVKPIRPFSETEKFKIDHYIMNGGSVLWAIDQVDADLDSLRNGGGVQTVIPRRLNLDDQLFTYGVRFNYDLIADLNCAQIPLTTGQVGAQPQIELAPWLFYPVFVPTTAHPLLKNLDGIRSEFAGTIDTIAVDGVRKTFILHSSPFSRVMPMPATISLNLVEEAPDPTQFKSRPYPVAALLEGQFPSVFADRPLPKGIDPTVTSPDRSKPAKMLVIADGDIFSGQVNPTDRSPYPLGWDRYTQQQFGNKAFLLNAIDYLTDDADVIALREKEVRLRVLDPVRLRQDRLFWQLACVALPLILLLSAGLAQQYLRKRRYGVIRQTIVDTTA